MFTWEGPPSPFFHFPLLFLDDNLDNDNIMDSLLSMNNAPPATNVVAHGVVDDVSVTIKKQQQTTSKKDRHGKIRTAHGLRDRRMRLSLKVARSFFDLQDMLGFDKASKTVEWLLNTSKVAIHQLASDKNMVSLSASESEVEYEAAMEMEDKPQKEKRKRTKPCRAAISVNPLAREIRDKARARARERTREKMMARSRTDQSNPKTSKHYNLKDCGDSADFMSQEHQVSIGMIEQLLGITSPSSSSSPTFSYNHEFPISFMGNDQPIIEPAASCYAMTSTRPSLDAPEHSNIISNGEQWSPSSILMTEPFS